jgi:hypothetical protein
LSADTRFLYDGCNLIAEFSVQPPVAPGQPSTFSVLRSYNWGGQVKSKPLFIFYLFSCGLSTLDAVPASDARLLYENQSGTADSMRTLSANLSSTEAAMDFLRKIRIEGSYVENGITIHRGTAVRLLAILGDTATIRERYDAFLNAKNDTSKARLLNGDLGQILHPRVIAVLGPDLVMPTNNIRLSGEVDGFDAPYANASVILNVVIRSGYFTDGVQNWAKGLDAKHGWNNPELYIGDVRVFWAENAAHIEAGEYDLVRPPSAVSKPQEDPNLPATPAPSHEPTPKPVKSPVAASMPTPTPAAAPEPAANTYPVWWIVGLIILAVGVVFVTRNKSPKPDARGGS